VSLKVFLAGASGVVGRTLAPLLRDAGHVVTGTTRTAEGRSRLLASGIQATIVDVFDAEKLTQAVAEAKPDVVIHQLTDLAAGLTPETLDEVLKGNARVRREGTANLVTAARAAGVKRLIAQSIAFVYAPKTLPYLESDPLDTGATGPFAETIRDGVVPLETAVLGQGDFEGIILRYGQFYGPGTWTAEPNGASPVHVEAAAYAAFLAVDRGRPGIYNIADPGGAVSVDKALSELGWRPNFRLSTWKSK
jgi:nucleoside-diphosphate-sugar epimerase